MKLYQQIRSQDVLTGAFVYARLAVGVVNIGENLAAAILFRTIALTALTFRENANAANNAIAIPESQKVFPIDDCLFVFGPKQPNNTINFNILSDQSISVKDTIIANNELGTQNKSINSFRDFIGDDLAQRQADLWPVELQAWQFGVLSRNIIFNNYNIAAGNALTAAQLIANNPNNPNTPITINDFQNNMVTFFDEVNMVHNAHKETGRYIANNQLLNRIVSGLTNTGLQAGLSFAEPGIYITIHRSGNLEGVNIQNGGSYPYLGKYGYVQGVITSLTLTHFKDFFTSNVIPVNTQLRLPILRDLFRLECIREPASLITIPTFHELALSNNANGYITIMNYKNNSANVNDEPIIFDFRITGNVMPMGREGSVEDARKLVNRIITRLTARNYWPIYYRYDYANSTGNEQLSPMETDLLFHYVMYLSNLTAPIRASLYGNDNKYRARYQQQERLVNNGWNNLNNILSITVNNIAGGVIVFNINMTELTRDVIQFHDIKIVSFPLRIFNDLIIQWYGIDIQLQNTQITNTITLEEGSANI